MISGTYILTDTIKAAFSTVFTTVYEKTDAVDHRQDRHRKQQQRAATCRRRSRSRCSARCAACPGVAEAEGGISDDGPSRRHATARSSPAAARPASRSASTRTATSASTRSRSNRGTWPVGPHEVAIDAHTASKEHLQGRPDDRRRRARAGDALQDRRDRQDRRRLVARRRDDGRSSTSRPRRRSSTRRRSWTAIDIAAKPGTSSEQLVKEIQPILPPTAQVRTAAGAGRTGDEGHERLPVDHQRLPARVRRRRSVRRSVRDREHAFDHRSLSGRANSRRCERSARRGGRCALRPPRGGRHRGSRIVGRAFPRPRARQGPQLRSSSKPGSTCPRRGRCSRRGPSSSRWSSASSSRCSRLCGRRFVRRACRTDRRGTRGRGSASPRSRVSGDDRRPVRSSAGQSR